MTTAQHPPPERSSRAPVIAALVTLAAVLALVFGSFLVRDGEMYPEPDPSAGPSPSSGAEPGAVELSLPARDANRCLPVDAQTLGGTELAFDGEVLEVDDETVTLAVREWYAGEEDAAQVRLDLAEVPTSLAGYFDFRDGRRYLVAANDATVMVCGFSAPYSAELESIYQDAFAGS